MLYIKLGLCWHILLSVSQSVQLLSRVRLFVTPWIAAHQASLSITNSRLKLRLNHFSPVRLCATRDDSPPGSPVPGILQARTRGRGGGGGRVAISFSNAEKWKVKVKSLSHVQPSAIPWTAAFQAPPSMGFSRQEYSSTVTLPSPPTPGVLSNSCPSSLWCHPAIPSSVVPFSSWPQSLPASECFPMSQLCSWGGQSIGVSASASVLTMNTQDWSPLGLTGWISL